MTISSSLAYIGCKKLGVMDKPSPSLSFLLVNENMLTHQTPSSGLHGLQGRPSGPARLAQSRVTSE